MSLVTAVVQIPVLVWVAQSRRWRAADYLDWVVPKPRDVAVTFAVVMALVLAGSALLHLPQCPRGGRVDDSAWCWAGRAFYVFPACLEGGGRAVVVNASLKGPPPTFERRVGRL
jgi:hypothetical protein